MEKEKVTINDIARDLGVSISTVSRAISGKGRIGEATRQKILAYIEAKDFHPNGIAKSLAQSKTSNIAFVIPAVSRVMEMPFFHICMCGVNEVARERDYDMFVVQVTGKDKSELRRLVENQKVDGIILSAVRTDDCYVEYLKEMGIPFVVLGSVRDDAVVQIGHDDVGACCELTDTIFEQGMKRIAYVCCTTHQVVDEDRFKGYVQSLELHHMEVDESLIVRYEERDESFYSKLDQLFKNETFDCILCQDDSVCLDVFRYLLKMGIQVPSQMKIASCYDSNVLGVSPISVTCLRFDSLKMGREAGALLIDQIEGKQVPTKTRLGYELFIGKSTKK